MPVTILDEFQYEEAQSKIAELEHLPRTDERLREISALTDAINAWQRDHGTPNSPPQEKEACDTTVVSIREAPPPDDLREQDESTADGKS
ncbi:hypothetical protein [Bosea sp. BK604]|uniref:hypothetical protein n=1 Tax=Bosea sp. BK604 TaxID=2512180 RepID=UPI001046A125|nr:hypothetical protein [Bosea sp. BK604]TCR68278.1 hypothetical protein EV560_102105 [Bosea sp. BK604]